MQQKREQVQQLERSIQHRPRDLATRRSTRLATKPRIASSASTTPEITTLSTTATRRPSFVGYVKDIVTNVLRQGSCRQSTSGLRRGALCRDVEEGFRGGACVGGRIRAARDCGRSLRPFDEDRDLGGDGFGGTGLSYQSG